MKMFFADPFLNDPKRNSQRNTWKNHFLSNDPIGLPKAVKGVLSRNSITAELSGIDIPTQILIGENDILTPIENSSIIQDNINNSTLHIIPRAGHMGPVEEPEFVSERIRDFLKSL